MDLFSVIRHGTMLAIGKVLYVIGFPFKIVGGIIDALFGIIYKLRWFVMPAFFVGMLGYVFKKTGSLTISDIKLVFGILKEQFGGSVFLLFIGVIVMVITIKWIYIGVKLALNLTFNLLDDISGSIWVNNNDKFLTALKLYKYHTIRGIELHEIEEFRKHYPDNLRAKYAPKSGLPTEV